MQEIRLHGRGGQGVRKAADVMGRAAFLAGYYVQDFAMYGAARREAPVAAFCRVDKDPILLRGYVDTPDYVIVLDEGMFSAVNVLEGLKSDGKLLINTPRKPIFFRKKYGFEKVYTIDATGISLAITGREIPNIALLGSFVRISKLFDMQKLRDAVKIEMELSGEALEISMQTAVKCYGEVMQ